MRETLAKATLLLNHETSVARALDKARQLGLLFTMRHVSRAMKIHQSCYVRTARRGKSMLYHVSINFDFPITRSVGSLLTRDAIQCPVAQRYLLGYSDSLVVNLSL